jgi:hypothetical protein
MLLFGNLRPQLVFLQVASDGEISGYSVSHPAVEGAEPIMRHRGHGQLRSQ